MITGFEKFLYGEDLLYRKVYPKIGLGYEPTG